MTLASLTRDEAEVLKFMMRRREFLGGLAGILAAGQAPWVCRASGVLMPVRDLWRPSIDILGAAGSRLYLLTKTIALDDNRTQLTVKYSADGKTWTDIQSCVFYGTYPEWALVSKVYGVDADAPLVEEGG